MDAKLPSLSTCLDTSPSKPLKQRKRFVPRPHWLWLYWLKYSNGYEIVVLILPYWVNMSLSNIQQNIAFTMIMKGLYQSVLLTLSVLPSWRSIPRKLWKSWGRRIISWQITRTPTSTSMSAQTCYLVARRMRFHVVDIIYIKMQWFDVVSCSTLSGLVEFDGFYLESDPCLVCNNPEVPFSVCITQFHLMDAICSHKEQMK